MNTTKTASLLTLFFALMCLVQVLLIAKNLDDTRSQLSNKGTGSLNFLIQTDRNLDQFLDAIVCYINLRHDAKTNIDVDEVIDTYRTTFDVFWAAASIFQLQVPGEPDQRLPEAKAVRAEIIRFLEKNDPFIFADKPMLLTDAKRIYAESQQLSVLLHELGTTYFILQSIFSDNIEDSSHKIFRLFCVFAFLLFCTGTFSAYSLLMANRRANESISASIKSQQRLTEVVSELRSGKLENKAKDSFIAAASHDLRQPLHALGLFLGALESHVEPAGRSVMEKARQSSDALTKLLSSLLDLSRLDAGVVNVIRKDFSIGQSLSTLEQEFQATAAERNMKLVFDKPADIIHTDRILLDRILRNLIENALTHSNGSILRVRCSKKSNDTLTLTLSDNGIGIPHNKHEDIFSEYYQIGNPERDRSKGLGLGLSIVKRLSDMLYLKLEIKSDTNTGCSYTLHIPYGNPFSQARPQPPQAFNTASGLTGYIIAVIEDDQEVREGMETILGATGHIAITAESAEEMVDHLTTEGITPDLLITDYRLRDNKTGTDAIKSVFAAVANKLPAVIITGDTSPKRVKEASLSGFTLLHKPIEPQHLLATIDDLLQEHADQALAASDTGAVR